jgi:peptide/nickel transport system permease protein
MSDATSTGPAVGADKSSPGERPSATVVRPGAPGPGYGRDKPASRSFYAQAVHETFRKWGARVGLAWIGFIFALAVLAPFLANSRPLLMKEAGEWSSPLVKQLLPSDVAFLGVGGAVLAGLLVRKLRTRGGALILVAFVGTVSLLGLWLTNPPRVVYYAGWRDAERAGRFEHVIRTPIPYSPSDRGRDAGIIAGKTVEATRPPSADHWLGTEGQGADLASQMIHATRVAISIGFISQGIAVALGIVIGGIMGYFAGWIDLLGMRLVEIFEAIPRLVLLLSVAALLGPDLYKLMIVIGATGWMGDARFMRAEFLRLRNQDFVQAGTALGLPRWSLLFRHMLPNGLTPILISSSFGVAGAILLESVLSYLGLGDAERASWGQLLDQARGSGGSFYWWIAVFPGAAIFMTVFAYNLIGEALRDALDPKLKKRD